MKFSQKENFKILSNAPLYVEYNILKYLPKQKVA